MQLIDRVVQFRAEIQQIRRDLHAHPELRFQETRTSDIVANKLAEWGLEVTRGLGGTGVVGTLKHGKSKRAVGLRADMDALPIQETNGFAHRSTHAGKMHACGHDGHMAMLLAAAKYLAEEKSLDGTVHFIFQPAEEGGAGAQRMIDDGLFERFACDAVFGMHNWPGLRVGEFGVTGGPMMASSNEFEITVIGKGAHAAMPHLGIDPVFIAVQIVNGLQGIITRVKKPIDSAVLSVTMIRAGEAVNVIPESAKISGTVRTFKDDVTALVEKEMKRIVEMTCAAHGAEGKFAFKWNYPPTVNDAVEAEFAATVMDDIVGANNVVRNIEPTMGAEDFAFMLKAKAGAYVFIGNGDGTHRAPGHGLGPCMLHNPSYDFNDELIPLGATYWVRLAQKFLARHL
ncbi:MAG TPA: M20 aminoacylase family protein [Burkholderiaceae bacterium]|nr:M20 aminoacylase family protein [Burkholderiaceae bacterium]